MARDRGFTLLEVMIALAILAMSLTVLIGSNIKNVEAARRVRLTTVATGLARLKMLDLEEELAQKGFQDLDQRLDGDFDDEEQPKFTWEAVIEKIELPEINASSAEEAGKNAGEEGGPLAGLLGSSTTADDPGASMFMSQFGIIKNVLEKALRKITLTVRWEQGREEKTLVVVQYVTEPKAVDEAMSGIPPAPTPTPTP